MARDESIGCHTFDVRVVVVKEGGYPRVKSASASGGCCTDKLSHYRGSVPVSSILSSSATDLTFFRLCCRNDQVSFS